MKFRILVAIVEKLLKVPSHGDAPRADMYLPNWLLAFGVVLAAAAIGLFVAFFITFNTVLIIIAVICAPIACAAFLCWRNQTIIILDEESFAYTTFLGNKKVFRFTDITALKRNNDSLTLFVGQEKVHIESIAVLSDRLVNKINAAFRQH